MLAYRSFLNSALMLSSYILLAADMLSLLLYKDITFNQLKATNLW